MGRGVFFSLKVLMKYRRARTDFMKSTSHLYRTFDPSFLFRSHLPWRLAVTSIFQVPIPKISSKRAHSTVFLTNLNDPTVTRVVCLEHAFTITESPTHYIESP